MHEMSVVLNIVQSVEKFARQYQVDNIGYVTVDVGEISGAVPQYLYQLWPDGTKGTICEGAELRVNYVCGIARCSACKTEYELTKNLHQDMPQCPQCGGNSFSFVQGDGVILTELGVPE